MAKSLSSSVSSILSRKWRITTLSIAISFAIFTFLHSVSAQETSSRLRIVFELSTGNDDSLQALATNVQGLQKNANSPAVITVVAYENGVVLLRTGNEKAEKQLAELADNGVDFVVCRTSLENAEISRNDILSFARTVKLGTKEIDQLEEQGWVRIPEGESYVTDL